MLALCLAAAAPARAAVVGLSDQAPATWSDARFTALGLRWARLVVSWDAATREPQVVDAWLGAVQAAGLSPHVAFTRTRTDRCPELPCTLPSRAAYAAAFAAFRARWPQVRTFTAWNEANHSSQPTARRPDAAAGYYDEAIRACPTCTIVAGDVLDAGDFISWLREFQSATTTNPQLWGVHNYGDVTYGQTSGTDAVLATVEGRLWVEETGGIVVLRNPRGQVTLRSDETRAASAIDAAFDIAKARSRIDRLYVYHWQAGPFDRFDAGLIRPDGSTRPSYDALRRNLGANVTTPPVRRATAIRWSARWANRARSVVALRGVCSPAGTSCTGRVRARLRVTVGRRTRTLDAARADAADAHHAFGPPGPAARDAQPRSAAPARSAWSCART